MFFTGLDMKGLGSEYIFRYFLKGLGSEYIFRYFPWPPTQLPDQASARDHLHLLLEAERPNHQALLRGAADRRPFVLGHGGSHPRTIHPLPLSRGLAKPQIRGIFIQEGIGHTESPRVIATPGIRLRPVGERGADRVEFDIAAAGEQIGII